MKHINTVQGHITQAHNLSTVAVKSSVFRKAKRWTVPRVEGRNRRIEKTQMTSDIHKSIGSQINKEKYGY